MPAAVSRAKATPTRPFRIVSSTDWSPFGLCVRTGSRQRLAATPWRGVRRGEPRFWRPYMPSTRIAIGGLGAIGRVLARRLSDGIPGLELACAAAGDKAKARGWLDEQKIECPVVEFEEFPERADLAIECAPASVIDRICRPMLEARKQVMVLSCGALLPRPELLELARERGGAIIVPTGALLGLDAVAAANEGIIQSVRMTTRKPPNGLAGAPHLVRNGISVEGLNEAKRVFSGTAREAAAGFPANVNVVAALSLAGIGPDRTIIEIWADPGVTRNCHT